MDADRRSEAGLVRGAGVGCCSARDLQGADNVEVGMGANGARQACVDSSIERSIFGQDTVYRLVIMQPSLSGL